MNDKGIAEVGRNCWRQSQAERFSILVDAESYFTTLKKVLPQARHSILLIGWEFDSRTRLERTPDAQEPNTIGGLLDHVVRKTPSLRAHVLIWDSALLYSFTREFFTRFKMDQLTHRRLHFRFDDSHPFSASHHQKIVVIDDALAFVGGLDISNGRWDSREHTPGDPRRSDPTLTTYPPFHDLMAMVAGPIAADLGDLARERWRCATGQKLPRPPAGNRPWPPGVEPGLRDVQVAIARTSPAWEGEPARHEVENLYVDMIAAAREHVYLECQYFASRRIGQALAARLQREPTPEVVVVSSNDPVGLLERTAMGASRARLYGKLSGMGAAQSLRLYYPVSGEGNDVKVHSKLAIVDDVMLRVGSSNLNNRSFGLDTECDLFIEAAGDARIHEFIRNVRLDLFAEHLGVGQQDVAAAEAEGGWLAGIERLRGGPRSLVPLGPDATDTWSQLLPAGDILDPEKPVESIILESDIGDDRGRNAIRRQMIVSAGLLLAACVFTVLWRWAPLPDLLDVRSIGNMVQALRQNPAASLISVGAMLLGSLLGLPVTILITLNGAIFGFLWGTTYSIIGCMLSGAVLYDVGRRLGRDRVRRVAGRRVTRVNRSMVRSGIMVVATLRLAPIATFPVVSLVAGSARIRPQDYVVGTLIGAVPVSIGFSLFGSRMAALLRDPDALNLLLLALTTTGLIALSSAITHRLARAAAPATMDALAER